MTVAEREAFLTEPDVGTLAAHGPEPVRIAMRPERWFSVDYPKMTLPDDAPVIDG